jgi:hypothetical protein
VLDSPDSASPTGHTSLRHRRSFSKHIVIPDRSSSKQLGRISTPYRPGEKPEFQAAALAYLTLYALVVSGAWLFEFASWQVLRVEAFAAPQVALVAYAVCWTATPLPADAPLYLFSEGRALKHVEVLAKEIGERQVGAYQRAADPVQLQSVTCMPFAVFVLPEAVQQ